MWTLNRCAFASTGENGALILYFNEKKVWNFKRTAKHCKYFCLFYEILMSNQRKEPFFLYKKFKSKQKNPHFLNNPSLCRKNISSPPLFKSLRMLHNSLAVLVGLQFMYKKYTIKHSRLRLHMTLFKDLDGGFERHWIMY